MIGTAQFEANVIIWEISTNLLLMKLPIPNCAII
jgi:hypothetical protein